MRALGFKTERHCPPSLLTIIIDHTSMKFVLYASRPGINSEEISIDKQITAMRECFTELPPPDCFRQLSNCYLTQTYHPLTVFLQAA